ncbi:hypothetical protein Yalta_039 [Yalta virus]|nr:hypothetical protein Yalta_039 [Yalta virus]
MLRDIVFYLLIIIIFFFSILCLIRLFIVILNINFNKIYLTREFSILKLTDDNEVDIAAILELTSQVNALEQEYEDKKKQYDKGFNDLTDLNTTYTILLNANTILKSEIEIAQQKLDTVQKIVDATDDHTKAEMSLLFYQTLLFRNYMFLNFAQEVYKHQEEKENSAKEEEENQDKDPNE